MPIYRLASSSLPQYLSWYNRHAIDNKIPPCVIRGILEKAGKKPTDDEVQKVINSISIDSSGINCQAFMDTVSSYHELRNPDTEYRAAFRIYDTKGEEKLSKEDVVKMFAQMHMAIDVDVLFEEADADKNGFIDYEEFVTLMKR